MKVLIDTREKDRVDSATKYYTKQGLDVSVEELPVGDYVFDNKVCFELKMMNDFIKSIQDHRVFNQSIDMAETYDYNFVIIVGNESTRAKYLSITKNYRYMKYSSKNQRHSLVRCKQTQLHKIRVLCCNTHILRMMD